MDEYKKLLRNGKNIVFETEWFAVEAKPFDHIAALQGKPYYIIHAPPGVLILAMTEDEKVIFIRQYRPAMGVVTLELPSGGVDSKETPCEAAIRELFEETGYICKEMRLLSKGRLVMNRVNAFTYAFLGTQAVKQPDFSPQEDIQVELINIEDIPQLVLSGEMEQYSMASLFALADWKFGCHFIHSGVMEGEHGS
jgi:ADP-ribose pyrophosphatase